MTRRRDPADERSVLVALTPRGDELRARPPPTCPATWPPPAASPRASWPSLRDTLTTLTQATARTC